MSHVILFLVLFIIAAPTVAAAQDVPARTAESGSQTYFAFQVEREARVKSAAPPKYPAGLRVSKVEGEVLVQYVVDERGEPDMETLRVVRSTHADFTDAVRRSIATMSFYPAEVQGRRVRQLVQQPFKFALGR